MWAESLERNKAYLSLFFAVSNDLTCISPWQKKYIFRGNIASATRKLITFENCLNPASPILIMEGSVYTRNTHCFIPAEGIDQIKLAFTCRGLKHTLGSTIWMQRALEDTFGGCNQLRSCFVQNETTDFGMCEGKLMQLTS